MQIVPLTQSQIFTALHGTGLSFKRVVKKLVFKVFKNLRKPEKSKFQVFKVFKKKNPWKLHRFFQVFSERELKFTFAICHRPSVCRLSVTFVRRLRPIQAIEIFGNVSTPLAIHDLSVKNLRRSSQGNPSVGGVKHKRGSQIQRFWTYTTLYLGNGAGAKLLITNRKSHELSIGTKLGDLG